MRFGLTRRAAMGASVPGLDQPADRLHPHQRAAAELEGLQPPVLDQLVDRGAPEPERLGCVVDRDREGFHVPAPVLTPADTSGYGGAWRPGSGWSADKGRKGSITRMQGGF